MSVDKDPGFETLAASDLCNLLVEFFSVATSRQGQKYGPSSMINIRSGLNRYLRSPPFNRPLNLMHGPEFGLANATLRKRLQVSRQDRSLDLVGFKAISHTDLNKMYDEYFVPGIDKNPEVLLHKVFFDLSFYLSKRSRDGFRYLTVNSFEFCLSKSGRKFVKLKEEENMPKSVKYQETDVLEKRGIILAQDSPRCPVQSLRLYLDKIHKDVVEFFQRPNKLFCCSNERSWYHRAPLGQRAVGNIMRVVSENACLSTSYTNCSIRVTANRAKERAKLLPAQEISDDVLADSLESQLTKPIESRTFKREADDLFSDHDGGGNAKLKSEEADQEARASANETPSNTPFPSRTADSTMKKTKKVLIVLPKHLTLKGFPRTAYKQ